MGLTPLPELLPGYCIVYRNSYIILLLDTTQGWEISSDVMWHVSFNHDTCGVNKANLPQYDIFFVVNCRSWGIKSMQDQLKDLNYLANSPYVLWRR